MKLGGVLVFILLLSCQNPMTTFNTDTGTNIEIVDDGYNYLWDYEYVYNKGFVWDFSSTSMFVGTWESETEVFIFDIKTFSYKNYKTNTELNGEYGKMNNGEDLYCSVINGGSSSIVIFTPFEFINNQTLYLGIKGKGVLFNKR